MRTYNTIAEMHEVAKAQWRECARETIDSIEILGQITATDDGLWDWANAMVGMADEGGNWTNPDGTPWCTMEMESWARGLTDGIEDEIEILELNIPSHGEMVETLETEFDLTTIGAWMMDAIPDTLTKMQIAVLGEAPEDDSYTDEQNDAFYKAFWQAICKANI